MRRNRKKIKMLSSMIEIAGRVKDYSTLRIYEMASGKNREHIFEDLPKMRYFFGQLSIPEKAWIIITDVMDMYQGYYYVGPKERINNIKELIKSYVYQFRITP